MGRDRDERRGRVSAERRVNEHSSGDRMSLKLPDGLKSWADNRKPGTYRIEIIPFEVTATSKRFLKSYARPGDWYYERTYFQHQKIGVNGDSFLCPARTYGKPCPICEHRAKLAANSSDEMEKLVAALKPKERQVFLIVDRAFPEKGVQLWEVSNWCFGKQLDEKLTNADPEDRQRVNAFADVEDGLTLKLAASEESLGGGGGKYLKFGVDEFRDRKSPLEPEWIDHGYDLDDCVRELTYAELKKVFLQTEDDEDAGRPAAKPAAASRNVDDDDPPPRNKPAAKPTKDAEEDDGPKSGTGRPTASGSKPTSPKPPTPTETSGEWAVGATVSFAYKGPKDKVAVRRVGEIAASNPTKAIARVAVEGFETPFTVDYEDLTAVDAEPAPARGKRPEPADDDPPPRSTKPAKAAPPDDDPPPRAAKPAPAKAAPVRANTGWDDDDDDFDRSKKR